MEFRYFMPAELYFGEDAVLKNKDIFKAIGSKALIVTGRSSAKKNGSYDDVTQALSETGVEYLLFDEVEENPSLETIEKAAGIGKANQVDFVIGIGGGSPMDAAKAIAVFIKNPEIDADNIFSGKELESIPVVAVATTSGTGSEVTQYSIVTSNKEKTKKNLGQIIFPKAAFLDYKYTYDLPYDITVNTALDAFTHLVEGFLSSKSTTMSDIYAEKGFELFKDCFKRLLDKELDREFRSNIMLASTLAGMLISQSGTSLPHGMGYPLTYYKGLPHGLANSVLTMEYLKSFKDKTKIEKMLNLLQLDDLADLEGIFKKLINVRVEITEEEIMEYAQNFLSNKDKLKNHPEEVQFEDIVQIYSRSLCGEVL
ncbi:alcohol dehydrogenase, class IV [Desulfitobacterium dehalogenans ATCC 51507]|uniref:Alcohol dehydrogenase, class IV n=1 Tax=Desulfitobacterium dehalogenans (strain ATCC 51507 / DSM 9161 / JW/IU-DC1) TaxID=756499 RepID=I4A4U7_DESDJ|nr:iron-containing alcohol dehydrogenase family protein [Desulfitobacterium dehalogenans]AFL98981.1 alcohol dehydrogenase, class IV [Desulfitobacterium dehalogenans ATCC 51507]